MQRRIAHPALPRAAARRRGLTLVEMLVATAVSLIMILGISQMFALVGDGVARGRTSLEMSDRLTSLSTKLGRDLAGITVSPNPRSLNPIREGYFEYIEGPLNDLSPTVLQGESLLGDVDDVLCMTVRSTGQPFVGQVLGRVVPFMSNPLTMTTLPTTFNGPTPPRPVTHYWVLPPHQPDTYSTVRSDTAEIIYWVTLDDKNNNGVRDTGEFYKLHRRVMPILPNLVFHPNYNTLTRSQFLNICDISTRIGTVAGVNTYVSNTLAELGDREHRYGHAELVTGNTFPFRLIPPGAPNRFYPNPHPQFTSLPPSPYLPANPAVHPFTSLIATYDATRIPNTITLNSVNEFGGFSANAIQHQMLRRGSDVIVTNVVAFDIKAFDPKAWILSSPTTLGDAEAYEPSDPGYQALLGAGAQVSQGAFVDLFYSRNLTGFPANMASDFSGQTTASSLMMPNINYPAVFDSWRFVPGTGSDGIDNNGDGLIDDVLELDAAPPYLAPLSGLQVRLRVYDESTRLVKQSTVQHSFK